MTQPSGDAVAVAAAAARVGRNDEREFQHLRTSGLRTFGPGPKTVSIVTRSLRLRRAAESTRVQLLKDEPRVASLRSTAKFTVRFSVLWHSLHA